MVSVSPTVPVGWCAIDKDVGVRGRKVSLIGVIWVVIGLIVAANHNFLDHLDTVSRVLSAVLAVAVWPLVVFHVHFGI